MLKILFGLLFLANAGLIAYQHGYLDAWSPASREPTRLQQQLHPEQLKLMPAAAAKPAVAAPEEEKSLARADKISNVMACTELGNFDVAEAKKFETQIAALSLGERLTRRAIPEATRHMVYIAPLGGKEAADKKAGELKRLGVEDFFVIQDGSALQWGISLGIFKSEEAARNQLTALSQKGVRSARIGAHNPTANKFAFQLRGLDASAKGRLGKIKEDFPRQEMRECASPPAA